MTKLKTSLIIFDMDGTLIRTEPRDTGEKIWLDKKCVEWPHKGWWGRKETLCLETFSNDLIPYTYECYLESINNPNNLVVLMTGRHKGIKKEVLTLLDSYGLMFDLVKLNDRGETLDCKKLQIDEILLEYPTIDKVVMYEDRDEHIIEFKKFFSYKELEFNIIHIK
jgi:hypothetical protein